ncbi:MAG: LysR family transcriptional regulator [Solirubrobacterales bacterium]
MNLSWFKILGAISKEGSISAAATELHYTQSVVSRQLVLLEQATGHKLVERSWQGARLTPAGTKLLEHAEVVMDRIDLALAELEQTSGTAAGAGEEISLATYQHPLATFVPEAVRQTRLKAPDTHVQLRVTTPKMAAELVLDGDSDVAVTLLGPNEPPGRSLDQEIQSWKLFDDTLVCVLPQKHRLADRAEIDLVDLAEESWALGAPDGWCPLYRDFRRACDRNGFAPKQAFELEDMFARVGLVVSADVLTIIPWSTVNESPSFGVVFKPFSEVIHTRVSVIARRDRTTGAAGTLIQELLKTADQHAALHRLLEPVAA